MTLPAPAPLLPLLCCLFAMTAPAHADLATSYTPSLTEQAKLVPSDGDPIDDFGATVAVSGDTAVIGAPIADNAAGSAYVFLRNGASWSEQVKLVGTERTFLGEFGTSVAISGETIVVGAPGEGGAGSAYIFVRNGPSWSLQAKLTNPDASQRTSFGSSVAIDGETAIVGASCWDSCVGSAYIFVRSGSLWSEQARLHASGGKKGDAFGFSVAISGGSAAVGAYGRQDYRGAAYIFARSGSSWSEQAQFRAPDGGSWTSFGRSVAISGDSAAVGAPGVSAAYVFRRTGTSWLQEAKLTSDGREGGGLGESVALSGDTLAVGADGNAAHAFVRGLAGWSERAELHPSDLGESLSNTFGNAIALSGDTVIVGAMLVFNPDYNPRVGSGYVFSLSYSPGVTVSPVRDLVTTEGGGTAQFLVVLNSQPAGDVVIDLASSDPGEGSVSPAQLRFTPQDWSIPQTVTLTGVNDFVQDANQPYSAVVSMNTALTTDPTYAGIDPPDVSAVNLGLEGDFYTITPCRVLDTRRPDQGPALLSGVKRLVSLHDTCGIPATAGAVAINVTVVEPFAAGTLKISPGDLAASSFGVLNFQAGQTVSSNAIVLLATDNTGTVAVWSSLGSGYSHLIIEASGYFE